MLRTILMLLLLGLLAGCKSQFITGYYTRQQFLDTVNWPTKVKANYRPDPAIIRQIQALDSFEVRAFVGTWCHDSRWVIPRLLAMQPQLPIRSLQIIAIDTTRRDPRGMAQAAGVRATPATLFLRGGVEIGRVVERGNKKLPFETNMLAALKGQRVSK